MTRNRTYSRSSRQWTGLAFLFAAGLIARERGIAGPVADAATVVAKSGFPGGVVVHVGCRNAEVLRRVAAGKNVLGQGLMETPENGNG